MRMWKDAVDRRVLLEFRVSFYFHVSGPGRQREGSIDELSGAKLFRRGFGRVDQADLGSIRSCFTARGVVHLQLYDAAGLEPERGALGCNLGGGSRGVSREQPLGWKPLAARTQALSGGLVGWRC